MSKLAELQKLRNQMNVVVDGLDNYFESRNPKLIISNHNCLMDIFYLPAVIPEDVISLISARLLYKKELERQKMVYQYLNPMPIEAHGGKAISDICLENSVYLLKNGFHLNIFPEDAYVPGNFVYRGRTGAIRILFEALSYIDVDLIPVAIKNVNEIKALDSFYPTQDEFRIFILPKVHFDFEYQQFLSTSDYEIRNRYLHAVMDKSMASIAHAMNREYKNEYIELFMKGNIILPSGELIQKDEINAEIIHEYSTNLRDYSRKLQLNI